MKNLRKKEKFVELRAQGLSFERISSEIGISKPTLIKWSREFSDQIANILYCNVESLLERYRLLKQFRIEALSRLLNKALIEIENRDFANVSTKDLFSMIFNMEEKLKNEISNICYHTGDSEDWFDTEVSLIKEKTISLFY